MDSTSDAQGRVELLAEEFLDRRKRGERPTIGEYCDQYPEHANEIREVFEALLMVEDLKPGSSNEQVPMNGFAPARSVQRPVRIGGYRVLREIGRGGMGVVYEAEQEALGRRVALKVLPNGMTDDDKAKARFEREARAAARMHHTNIVPVFDVGSDGGQLFYAMQIIHGQGLDLVIEELKVFHKAITEPRPEMSIAASLVAGRFAEENLGVTETDVEATADYEGSATSSAVLPGHSEISSAQSNRRAYYRSVAQIGEQTASALAYAHARGVVHRDIKPSNLLLDTAGVVWVTDFGLAKTGDLDVTQTGDILGTIRYMAPERFRGQCDVRSDLYALGLTLYELLTLRPAFMDPDRLQLIEQIRKVDPPAPRSIDRKVPRDLETIVLKAIDKDPKRRYSSADEFGEDLQRFLSDEPVLARRIWLPERLVRWMRRNPAVAVLSVGIFLVMAAGTIVSNIQANRARKAEAIALNWAEAEKTARKQAEERDAETLAVLQFVENEILRAARPEGLEGGLGRDVTLRQAIEASLPKVGESFRDQPLIEARLRLNLSRSFLLLGEPRIALEQSEISRALYTKLRGPEHVDTLTSTNALADTYGALGRHVEAMKLYEETLESRQSRLGPDHPDTLATMHNLANSYAFLGRQDDAFELRKKTLALQQAKLGPEHPDTLASTMNLAISHENLGRFPEALQLIESTLAIRKAKLGPDHPDTLATMDNLAYIDAVLGRHDESQKIFETILPIRQTKLGPDHPETLATMDNLAYIDAVLGRHAESLELSKQALALTKAKLGPDHPDTIRCYGGIIRALSKLGRQTEAAALARQAAELTEKRHTSDPGGLYNAACCRAVAAAVLRAADTTPAGAKQADAEADRAMEWLKQAVAAGWTNAGQMATDTDLDGLRERNDFQAILKELKGKAPRNP